MSCNTLGSPLLPMPVCGTCQWTCQGAPVCHSHTQKLPVQAQRRLRVDAQGEAVFPTEALCMTGLCLAGCPLSVCWTNNMCTSPFTVQQWYLFPHSSPFPSLSHGKKPSAVSANSSCCCC